MKLINKLLFLAVFVSLVISACKKVDDLPYYDNGTAVTLTSSKTAVAPTPADSLADVVTFSWTNPEYATDSSNYKFIVEIDSTGRNFSNKVTKTVIGSLNTSFTGKELNDILLNYGFTLGTAYELDVRVVSSYKNNNEQYTSNVVKISVTAYEDPSVLAASATTVSPTLATSADNAIDFTWTPSFNGYSGTVTYALEYDSATKNFANPQEIAVGPSMYNKSLNNGEINETALNVGIKGETAGSVEYRIKATTALGAISYSDPVTVLINAYTPILRFYLPGGYQAATGNGNNWDPGTAPELIRDLRSEVLNDLYYIYIWLPTGAEFKVTQGRSWDVNYGGAGGDLSSNPNLSVSTAGFYRISISRKNMKYDIREGRMGFVGGATGAGWNPPSVFPNYAMGAAGTNLFVGITDLGSGGWKLIDNNTWNNGSNAFDETRSYGTGGNSGSTLQVNGDNFNDVASPGKYRVIWDGRDVNNIKYEISPATEMRVVGDGIQGVPAWNPGASPQMTYSGNGVWTITLTLVGGKDIKFLAGNDWGAFDYEDNSGGITATGTPRAIKWEGGDNFKTPATTGIYTITLNENTQTVTIN
ncbi:MAG: SusE domain-containing protein [Chitinophagaceae bacterium]|nr:SusE domain-containing protein [Chitinophagaceae bacterium]